MSTLGHSRHQAKQNIRAISDELLKVPNLQTLNIKIPCFCLCYGGIYQEPIFQNAIDQNAIYQDAVTVLQPSSISCQRSNCLRFARAFPDVKATVESWQTIWAGVRNKASSQPPEDDASASKYDLGRLCSILDSALETTFHGLVRSFGQTLDDRLDFLHETGRLEHFLDFEEGGIPPEAWETIFEKRMTLEERKQQKAAAKRKREEAREAAAAEMAEARKRPRRSARTMTGSQPSYKY
ncbi:MAG: hypothetical protein Q9208_004791 [Pyrenodesmia sp. 3 TL-2023]